MTIKIQTTNQSIQQQYDNFKKLPVTKKFRHICAILWSLIKWTGALLAHCICNIIPRSKDKLGKDIDQLKLTDCFDWLMQDHLDKFHKKIAVLWDPANAEKTLDLFKENLRKLFSDSPAPIGRLHYLTIRNPHPDMKTTEEEKSIVNMLYEKYIRKSDNKMPNESTLDGISLRDVKIYHNVCIKCMLHALKTKSVDNVHSLRNLFKVFEINNARDCILCPEDQENLRENKDFVELLEMFKKHAMPNVKKNRIHHVINLLVEHFVDNKPFQERHTGEITYSDMYNLMLFANAICRNFDKNKDALTIEKDIYILDLAEELGLIDANLVHEIKKKHKDLSEEYLKDTLLKHDINFDKIKACVERFPTVIHEATKFIDIPVFELFN